VADESVTFPSAGLKLSGNVRVPDGLKPGEKRGAFLVLHGFGSNKDSSNVLAPTKVLSELGYVTLRFSMRGCGDSEGEFGRVICLEQVEDTRNALTFLAGHPAVDPKRIAACISTGGWGHGEKKFRKQHASPEAWARFTAMMEKGRAVKKRGETLMVPRYEIVPIRPELRTNVAPGSILEFPFDVVESMYAFTANEVVGRIAPRPLLLMHPANDTVTPTEQSIDLFLHAGQPTDLHLVAGVDHFLMAEGNMLVLNLVRDWLAQRFPAR